jgi:hypothetical protein
MIFNVECNKSTWLLLVSFLPYISILKMEALYSSETSGCLRTTRRYNPEHYTFFNLLPASHCYSFVYFYMPKMEALYYSETSGSHPTTRRYNPEVCTLHSDIRENHETKTI